MTFDRKLPTLQTLSDAITTFNDRFSRPAMKTPRIDDVVPIASFRQSAPLCKFPGIYAFVIEQVVLYVGKTDGPLGKRIGSYLKREPSGDYVYSKPLPNEQLMKPTQVALITFPEERYFEAVALEGFLIGEIGPPLNRNGVKGKKASNDYLREYLRRLEISDASRVE